MKEREREIYIYIFSSDYGFKSCASKLKVQYDPQAETLKPQNPKGYTPNTLALNPKPYTLNPETLNSNPETLNPQTPKLGDNPDQVCFNACISACERGGSQIFLTFSRDP